MAKMIKKAQTGTKQGPKKPAIPQRVGAGPKQPAKDSTSKSDTTMSPAMKAYYDNLIKKKAADFEKDQRIKKDPWSAVKQKKTGGKVKKSAKKK